MKTINIFFREREMWFSYVYLYLYLYLDYICIWTIHIFVFRECEMWITPPVVGGVGRTDGRGYDFIGATSLPVGCALVWQFGTFWRV